MQKPIVKQAREGKLDADFTEVAEMELETRVGIATAIL